MKISISPDGGKWIDVECETEDIINVKYLGLIEGYHEFESFDKVYKFQLNTDILFEVGKEYQIRVQL